MCALFGIIDYKQNFNQKQLSKMTRVLGKESEARGIDAAGIAYVTANERMVIFKRPAPAHQLSFQLPLGTYVVMGHTRMTTQGIAYYNANNHPFKGRCSKHHFALAHNGVIHNDKQLKKTLPATAIETDSYVAVQLLEQQAQYGLDAMAKMAEQIEGNYTFTLLDQRNHLSIIKGDNPLALYHFPAGGYYMYASTEKILLQALKQLKIRGGFEAIEIQCGDILDIAPNGQQNWAKFDASKAGYCQPKYCTQIYEKNWGRSRYVWGKAVRNKLLEEPNDLLDMLFQQARNQGVDMEVVLELLEVGFNEYEVSQLIKDPRAWA